MLGLPYLGRRVQQVQRQVVEFGGVNYSQAFRDGELRESLGLTAARWPALSQRAGRRTVGTYEAPGGGVYARGKLLIADGTRLLYDGEAVGEVSQGEKIFVVINTKAAVFPDKLLLDLETGEVSHLDAKVSATVSFSSNSVTAAGLGDAFHAGDAVEISGAEGWNNGSHIVRSVDGDRLIFDDNVFTAGSAAVTLERKVPDFTCVCECDNRLWGAEGNTIYASALGDPSNYFVYDGLASDSYAVAVGTDGGFTGCTAYGGSVLFFKEDCLHKVLGSIPAQYQIRTTRVPGVQAGSRKSLAVINEVLYYKGREGVYAYTGGTPRLISENFGTRRFHDAAAGTDGERYFVSMREGEAWGLYVFDPAQELWLREDGSHVLDFLAEDGVLQFLDAGSRALVATGQDRSEEGPVAWSAEFCPFDELIHGRKAYSRILLRVELGEEAWVRVELSEDGAPFRQAAALRGHRHTGDHRPTGSVVIPVRPVRCDKFKLRLSGEGDCLVKSLVREFSVGSEY